MALNTKDIQLQYEGFLNTPVLWKGDNIYNLKQLELNPIPNAGFEGTITKNLRLGKRVERFVSNQLQQYSQISILTENTQIQNGTTTVGEIDFILQISQTPIHLEVIYKFYLYDETVGNSELDHWIGPNKKDSLVEKLTKLKNKQLPLLYNSYTIPLLKKLQLDFSKIEQEVYFKAQLFIPFHMENINFEYINTNCIKGFYIHYDDLEQFKLCKFHIPSKINWLQEIQINLNWLTYEKFSSKVISILNQETSPLCWMKKPNGEVIKFFITWWK
jgi:hypothetical protein